MVSPQEDILRIRQRSKYSHRTFVRVSDAQKPPLAYVTARCFVIGRGTGQLPKETNSLVFHLLVSLQVRALALVCIA